MSDDCGADDRAGTALVATDLDQTLIYSQRMIERHEATGPFVAVERYRDADASWMTANAAATLESLAARAVVVPTTTRTVEQLARVRLPGPAPRFAIAANGGVLLVDGVPDLDWRAAVQRRMAEVTPVSEVRAHAEATCAAAWTSAIRTAEGLFVYAVLDRALLPPGFVTDQRAWATERGWTVSLQGRKVYWVPGTLTKSAAVAEIARRVGADRVLAAGDSLLDADLLGAADAGILARHGELAGSDWSAPHVVVTASCGPAAGEEIVRWLAARVR